MPEEAITPSHPVEKVAFVQTTSAPVGRDKRDRRFIYLLVTAVAALIYLVAIISPPSLMDDVDAVQAQIARNMLSSGDWVTAKLDGVPYLEKSPLIYWAMATLFKFFGAFDWVARIPVALSAIALAVLTAAFGLWAFGRRAGTYAGLCVATCVGLFLFTRILIPDVMLTFTIALAMWAFLRVLDDSEPHPRIWAAVLAASIGIGFLLKSLIAAVFPLGTALIYLLLTRQLLQRRTWSRLHPISGTLIILAIAAPWHIAATLANPPYFVFTMRSVPGEYHGFFWFYFFNEQLLRFLNLRYPRDYDTVPRTFFWLSQLIWLFPWSVYAPGIARLSFKPVDRAGRTRLLALCWIACVMVFFTFSTTQEYYSMPIYPAAALLLGSSMARKDAWHIWGSRILAVISAGSLAIVIAILILVRNTPSPGDISGALSSHPEAYKLSMGHMEDLTLESFAYLRLPLAIAGVAFLVGTSMAWRRTAKYSAAVLALMMIVFLNAARIAMVTFDPYLSSRVLAEALLKAPAGKLIVNHHYYEFSSVFFYTNRSALLLNGRVQNLVYGSYAPGAAHVFIDDKEFERLWEEPQRWYFVIDHQAVKNYEKSGLYLVKASGGKFLFTNHALPGASLFGGS